jgi:hypothetical protein
MLIGKFSKNYLYIILLISCIIIVLVLFNINIILIYNSRNQNLIRTNPSITKVTTSPSPTISISTNENKSGRTQPEIKHIRAYGLEITEKQTSELVRYLKAERIEYGNYASDYFNQVDKWYVLDSQNGYIQERELFTKKPYICQLQHLVCMGTPNDFVDKERQKCLNSNTDYNNYNDWSYSNSGQCCKTLVSDISSVFSCANIDRNQENPISEELIFTYQLLKESGVDCTDHNCPPAIEKVIDYW